MPSATKSLALSLAVLAAAGQLSADQGGARRILDSFEEVQSLDLGKAARSLLPHSLADIERIALLQGGLRSDQDAATLLQLDRRAADGSLSTSYASSGTLTVRVSKEIADDPAALSVLENRLGGNLSPLGFDLFALDIPDNSINAITGALGRTVGLDGLDYAEFDARVFPAVTPTDPDYSDLWHLNNTGQTGGTPNADIDAPEAWKITTGAEDLVIGVIDTGIDYSHPDLAANIWINPLESGLDASGNDKRTNGIDDDGNGYVDDWRGWDFLNNDNDPFDDHKHGTHVAGTIAAVTDNGVGISGVAWNAKMIPLKFLGKNGGSTQNAIRAVHYASMTPAFATNNSWGGGRFSQALLDAIDANGTLFLAAAGNSNTDTDVSPHYPSSYDSSLILSVAATDHNDKRASFSNYGAVSVDIAAPGERILSTVPNGGYEELSGTSMAAPVVAGIAILVKAQNPGFSPADVKGRILARGDQLPGLNGFVKTGARVNAESALGEAMSIEAPVGSVLAYFGSVADIPVNWALADGRRVLDPASPLSGQDLPDLRSVFVMGANAAHPMGSTGGVNTAPSHSHQVGLSTNTVWFGMRSGNGYANAYNPATRADAFDRRYRNLSAPDGAANPYDSHGHMNGQAHLRGATAPGGVHDNRPAFVALNYIIRIK